MNKFEIEKFLEKKVLERTSFFQADIDKNYFKLKTEIFSKNILVIGGAGTIGSSYIKEILKFEPRKLVVVDINENGLTELTRYLRSSFLLEKTKYITYPIDINQEIFDKLFLNEERFHIIANFAAHKHVRSEKDMFSIEAMIRNNVYGAIKLIKLIESKPPNHFFCVSTDKAANPVNIMGASKKLMEKIILNKSKKIKISTARFANVAFSNGSLLESFIQRINNLQPISCPTDIKRFFVSPKESGQICLLATFLGSSGQIFFPKFNPDDQIFFKDILNKFFDFIKMKPIIYKSESEAKLHSFKDKNTWPVFLFESDTSGEKYYEEFYTENEKIDLISFDSVGTIDTKVESFSVPSLIKNFNNIFNDNNLTKLKIINLLNKYIPEFSHLETGKNLDDKM